VVYRWPQALPGGKAILISVYRPGLSLDSGDIAVLVLKTGQTKTIARAAVYGSYSPSGHLLYLSQNTLMAVRFDADRLETSGAPVALPDDVVSASVFSGAQFGVTNSGVLAYISGRFADPTLPLVWLDANGTRPLLPSPSGRVVTPRLSPDGKLLAFSVRGDLWVFDPARAVSTQLTRGAGAEYPVWTPDGRAIAFRWGAGGIGWVRADGSGPAQMIYESKSLIAIPQSFSPDGRHLAFHEMKEGGSNANRDIFQLAIDNTTPDRPKAGQPETLVSTDAADADPMISPDGRWLAYISGLSTGYNVFVRPYGEGSEAGGQVQITTTPGRFPLWSRARQEIFYVTTDGRIQVVPYAVNGRTFVPGKPRLWSSTPIDLNAVAYPLDIAPDGRSFVTAVAPDSGAAHENLHVTFLLNFFDELKRKIK
jgi:dipeptidyl aminopeptidase/acylaminoacyl peptidase